jgi:hypothetical protein
VSQGAQAAAAGNVLNRSTLNQRGPLTGAQFFIQVNLARACASLPPIWEPRTRETFTTSPVGPLSVATTEQGPRLLLAVTGPVTEDIMVFGQAPCSPGRHKRRNIAYLGLLTPAEDGVADITDITGSRRCDAFGAERSAPVAPDPLPFLAVASPLPPRSTSYRR